MARRPAAGCRLIEKQQRAVRLNLISANRARRLPLKLIDFPNGVKKSTIGMNGEKRRILRLHRQAERLYLFFGYVQRKRVNSPALPARISPHKNPILRRQNSRFTAKNRRPQTNNKNKAPKPIAIQPLNPNTKPSHSFTQTQSAPPDKPYPTKFAANAKPSRQFIEIVS